MLEEYHDQDQALGKLRLYSIYHNFHLLSKEPLVILKDTTYSVAKNFWSIRFCPWPKEVHALWHIRH